MVGLVTGDLLSSGTAPLFNGAITGPAINQFQQADAIFPSFWLLVLAPLAWVEGGESRDYLSFPWLSLYVMVINFEGSYRVMH